MSRDPYLVLDLHPGASLQEIQEAYQRLSALYDEKHQSTDELRAYARDKMRELNEAYQTLCGGHSGDFQQADSSARAQGNPYTNPYQQSGSSSWGSSAQREHYQQAAYPNQTCMGNGNDSFCSKLFCGICAWELCCDNCCC